MQRYALLAVMAILWVVSCGPVGGGTTPPDPDTIDLRSEELLLPGSLTPTLVTYRVVGDLAVIGGDIVIGTIDPGSGTLAPGGMAARELGTQGTGITAWSRLWPGGVIPYAIGVGVPTDQENDILDAMAHWEAATTIEFVERTLVSPRSLLFTRADAVGFDPDTCFATIGASVESTVWLGPACGFDAILHAIGHAVGMYHEHQRHDRSDHIDVIEHNVRDGFLHAFDELPSDLSLQAYDYDSVMHGPARTFVRPDAPESAVTMQVLAPGRDIGARSEPSPGDVATVDAMYDGDRAYISMADVLGSGPARTFTWTLENPAEKTLTCSIQVGYASGWKTIAQPDCASGAHPVTFEETGTIPAVLGVVSGQQVQDSVFFLLDIAPEAGVSVAVSPATVQLAPGGTTSFTATVSGASDPSVTWSVTGGQIDAAATPVTYTAPAEVGVFTVTATSVEDPTAVGTATVSVTLDPNGPRYTPEELAYFEEIAVGSEYGPDGWIARWPEDVLLRIEGTPTTEDRAVLDLVIGELNTLIQPVQIRVVEDAPTMRMVFAPVSDFGDIDPDYVPGSYGFFTFRFTGLLGPGDEKHLASIYEATGLVSSTEITQQQRSHLIREVLTQALGLGNDSLTYPESIFYDGDSTTTEYQAIDRAVIEMLYRPELTSDMTTAEILAALAQLRGAAASQTAGGVSGARGVPVGDLEEQRAGGG